MAIDDVTWKLIDELNEFWKSELSTHSDSLLIRRFKRLDDFESLMPEEQRIHVALCRPLSEEEWSRLTEIIAIRRHCRDHQAHTSPGCTLCQEREDKEREGRERRSREEREKLIALHKESLNDIFERDFLAADSWFLKEGPALIDRGEYDRLKAEFVSDWAKRELGTKLDSEQAAAVATVNGNVLVAARAGSGKTRTLVTRAIFLQKHCGVSPRKLMLLAFNRAAAEEMRQRLAAVLDNDLPHVMTFHALAHALVKPGEALLSDNVDADQTGLSQEVDRVVEEHIKSDEYKELIKNLMLAHFREDMERIVDGRLLPADEFVNYRRGLPRESLAGDRVESFVERVVANTLFQHDIKYRHKRSFLWDGLNYRPDFIIDQFKVAIECFGAFGQDDYDAREIEKRKFWNVRMKGNGWTFLEVSLADMPDGEEAVVGNVLRKLKDAGVKQRRLSEREIWESVRKRAANSFTDAMRNFIGRCRMRNLSSDELQRMVASHHVCSEHEGMFLKVGISVYAKYLERLDLLRKEDFNGLMWRATAKVRNGQTNFVRDRGRERGDLSHLRFVMIDEFQDFSQMFYELVDAIRGINPGAKFFCVGDDWQAINAFAGSELRFFERFGDYFHDVISREIPTNYRSVKSVVEIGNALMRGKGTAARPSRNKEGVVWLGDLERFQPSAVEDDRHQGGKTAAAVLRVVRHFLDQGHDVAMLSRITTVYEFVKQVRSFLPREDRNRVNASTTHKYKGREQEAVIVLDAFQGRYPLIHPNWIFLRVFGDTPNRIEEEERRLFYVALTRAKESLVILTDSTRESPHLGDIRSKFRLRQLSWDKLAPVLSLNDEKLEIHVSGPYEVRDQLKEESYQWNPTGRYWRRAVPASDFSIERLTSASWAANCRIEVYSESGSLLHKWPGG